MGYWRRLVRFAKAVITEQGCEYEAGGKMVSCRQCGSTRFFRGRAQLNTKDMTLWGLDYFDKSARTLRCKKCGFIHWFGKPLVNLTFAE
jgi:DNA-directed RNA polymerase subunit RPC12/RpoP